MAGTRSSTRSDEEESSLRNADAAAAGTKRKAETSSPKPEAKAPKKQQTIEEALASDAANNAPNGTEMKEASDKDIKGAEKSNGTGNSPSGDQKTNSNEEDMSDAPKDVKNEKGAVQESSGREKTLPTNIEEKGIIYFFFKNRVGIDEAESVGDLQRTFFVLRPLPQGAKLGDGTIQDLENNRLFALPKKVFPKSHNDRFMAFVEKANASIHELKNNFFKGEEYATKTRGTQQKDPVTPVAEGVYAITRTEDRTTHLSYAITIPSDIGEVQEDLGLRSQGSFIISVKNPERPGPASTRLPKGPEFPKEFIDEFRGLAWVGVKSKYLDYANCQVLLIGEKTENALEPTTKDKKHNKETPKEELEKLEHEDELRVEHLNGDDSIFDDLKISKKEYPQIPTTW